MPSSIRPCRIRSCPSSSSGAKITVSHSVLLRVHRVAGALADIVAVNVGEESGIIDFYDSERAAFIIGVFLRRDNVGWGRERY